MHVYCVFEKKSFVATSQAPFRSTFDRSRLLGDIDNLVNLFCNRFDMAVQRATQRTSGLLVSMLDVVDPLQAAKGLTFGHPIFSSLLSGQMIRTSSRLQASYTVAAALSSFVFRTSA